VNRSVFGKRILLLIPHPDDEVVGCSAAIGRAQAQGAEVFGFYLTTGVPPREVLWWWQRKGYPRLVERRRREAEEVAELLSIEAVGFQEIPSRTLKSFLGPTREKLIRAVQGLQIDTLWAPTYEGGHQDHDVANFLASTLKDRVQVWEFSEYHYFGRKVRCHEFFAPNGTERVLLLDNGEQALKRKALALYRSERKNLRHIEIAREAFRPLAGYDYRQPPHRGKLFYQRFQWVPAHPRIDHCRPEAVCQAFDRFMFEGGDRGKG